MYNQPVVEATEVQLTQALLGGSPGALENSGSGTSTISTSPGDPIIGG